MNTINNIYDIHRFLKIDMSKRRNIKIITIKIDVKMTFKNIILLLLAIRKFSVEVLVTG